ncbi:unnamed protein product [Bathycoccus prasinos]
MFSLSAAQFASTASSASLRSSQKSTKKSVRSSSMIVKNTASMDEMDSTTTSSSSSDMVDIDSAMQRAESPTMNNGQTYSENKPETFKEIMGFAGWAPEVINCRAGMVAFVAAMGAELQSYNHETFGALLITAASFMPSMQNAEKYTSKPSSKPYGIFTPEAEITNGRMAIIGLVAATVAEKVMGHGIFA